MVTVIFRIMIMMMMMIIPSRFLTLLLAVGKTDPLFLPQGNIIIIVVVVLIIIAAVVVVIIPIIRYGHTCLLTEVAGTRGIMVAGGALAGKQVLVIIMMTMVTMVMTMVMMTMVMIMMMTVVVGGALANKQVFMITQVDFLDLATSEWRQLPSLNYKIGESDLKHYEIGETNFNYNN